MSKRGRGADQNGAPFLVRHMGGLRYFRRVPKDTLEAIGRKVWAVRFDAKIPGAAIEHECRRLAAHHDDLIRRARSGEVLDKAAIEKAEQDAADWLRQPPAKLYEFLAYIAEQGFVRDKVLISAVENRGVYRPTNAPTISQMYKRDVEQHGGQRKEKTIALAVDSFKASAGDKPITQVTRTDVQNWIAAMSKGRKPATVQRRLTDLRAMFNRTFLDLDIEERNPFERHKIADANGGSDDRVPFNKPMLERIESYLVNNKRVGHESKNIIRLLWGTGATVSEIGGLVMADVVLNGPIPYVWLRPNAVRPRLKNKNRNRQVPLIGAALDAAKDAVKRATAAQAQRTSAAGVKDSNPDTTPLFESYGTNGRGADSISAKINKNLRSAGIPGSPRLVAHSFRHTMKEALRTANVADHDQRRLLGHAGHGIADRYGAPRAPLERARDALVAAMEHLGDVDDSIFSTKERMESKRQK